VGNAKSTVCRNPHIKKIVKILEGLTPHKQLALFLFLLKFIAHTYGEIYIVFYKS
jgi:hypothetical protein